MGVCTILEERMSLEMELEQGSNGMQFRVTFPINYQRLQFPW